MSGIAPRPLRPLPWLPSLRPSPIWPAPGSACAGLVEVKVSDCHSALAPNEQRIGSVRTPTSTCSQCRFWAALLAGSAKIGERGVNKGVRLAVDGAGSDGHHDMSFYLEWE